MTKIFVTPESCILPGFVPLPSLMPNDPLFIRFKHAGQDAPAIGRVNLQGNVEVLFGVHYWFAAREISSHTQFEIELKDLDDKQAFVYAHTMADSFVKPNPMEVARSYVAARSNPGFSFSEMARLLGMKRSTLSNIARLLDLPAEIQKMVRIGTLSYGKAQHLLGLPESAQMHFADLCITENWSAKKLFYVSRNRELSNRPGSIHSGHATSTSPALAHAKQYETLEKQISELLSYPFEIHESPDGCGQIKFSFHCVDALRGLVLGLMKNVKHQKLYSGSITIPFKDMAALTMLLDGLVPTEDDW